MRRALAILVTLAATVSFGCSRQQSSEGSFCDLIPEVDDLFALLQGFEAADPAELNERFDQGLAEFRGLERAAPREIKPDVAELGNVMEDVLDAVRRNDGGREAIAADLDDLQSRHPGAAASALRVIEYARDTCGVTLDGGGPSAPASPSVPTDPPGPSAPTDSTGPGATPDPSAPTDSTDPGDTSTSTTG